MHATLLAPMEHTLQPVNHVTPLAYNAQAHYQLIAQAVQVHTFCS